MKHTKYILPVIILAASIYLTDCGGIYFNSDNFYRIGSSCTFWSSSESEKYFKDNDCALVLYLYHEFSSAQRLNYKKRHGFSVRCLRDNPVESRDDYEGNKYKSVIIGTQEWMVDNLNIPRYRNGDAIPEVKDRNEWSKLTTGAWCYYDNDSENGETYGRLYNWYAVNDSRGLAPKGWHIPSDSEWKTLIDYVGGKEIAGGKLKATTLWESPNKGATNGSGFTALPGGSRLDTTHHYMGNIYEIQRSGSDEASISNK